MKSLRILLISYTVLLVVGGVMGFFVGGSTASLISSLFFSALLLLAVALFPLRPKLASFFSLFSLTLLSVFFVYRFTATQKWMPGGILGFLTLLTLTFSIRQLLPLLRRQGIHPSKRSES